MPKPKRTKNGRPQLRHPTSTVKSAAQTTEVTRYPALARAVRQELEELDVFIRRRTAESYWRVGRFIHEHLLGREERAGYASGLFEKLAADVGRDATTLSRCVQFFRAYPILAAPQELSWEHYKSLITIHDDQERKKLEKLAVRHEWNTKELRNYLRTRRARDSATTGGTTAPAPAAQLTLTRGRLNIYQIIRSHARGKDELFIDCGFGILRPFPGGERQGFKDGALVEHTGGRYLPADVPAESRYTFKAWVERVVDGDTLLVLIETGGGDLARQRLRLRGINCPELAAEEGRKAKRFVERRLRACPFIIIRTYKERKDLYARYIADVFYLPDCADPTHAAAEGRFLNQDLLDEGHAVVL